MSHEREGVTGAESLIMNMRTWFSKNIFTMQNVRISTRHMSRKYGQADILMVQRYSYVCKQTARK